MAWHLYMMEYYSAIKKNEITASEVTWMDLEIVIVSDVKSDPERHTSQDAAHVWILNKGADEVIYRTQDNSQIEKKAKLCLPGVEAGRNKFGDWDWYIHTPIHKIDN